MSPSPFKVIRIAARLSRDIAAVLIDIATNLCVYEDSSFESMSPDDLSRELSDRGFGEDEIAQAVDEFERQIGK